MKARMEAISQYDKDCWDKALDICDFDISDYVKMTHEGRYSLEPTYKGPYVVVDKIRILVPINWKQFKKNC